MNVMRVILPMIAAVFFAGNAMGADSGKFGVMDMQKLQEKSVAFQKIRDQLKATFDTLQKQLDEEKEALMKLEEEYKKQSMMLSLDAREDKKKELEKKRRHYKYLADEYTRQMQDEELDAKRRIGKEIEVVVEEIGKREGYVMIFERRTVGLVYYRDALDITDEVIRKYDARKK